MDHRIDDRHRFGPYPPISPYRVGRLKVSDLHEIYFEECGNPNGIPALVVHGGPGGGSNPFMRRFHDPERFRIILFDQRGCGRSTPHAELRQNTTWDLVDDIEQLRNHLVVDRWQLFGGSWGSTLALTYAISHPSRVSSLVLRGIFLMRRHEVEWFYQDGCNRLFPDAYAPFLALIPEGERSDMVAAYHRRLTGDDPLVQLAAAKAWSAWEGRTLTLRQDPRRVKSFEDELFALAFARIESHYFHNRGFFDRDDYLLANIAPVRAIPTAIIHGRYDVVTPVANAWDLAQALPNADFRIVPEAGHAMTEPGIAHELISATRRLPHVGR